jgi:hypothetical protein
MSKTLLPFVLLAGSCMAAAAAAQTTDSTPTPKPAEVAKTDA